MNLNLASVLAMQAAAKEARAAAGQQGNISPTVAVKLEIFEDLLEDLVDFHAGLNRPKKGKKK